MGQAQLFFPVDMEIPGETWVRDFQHGAREGKEAKRSVIPGKGELTGFAGESLAV